MTPADALRALASALDSPYDIQTLPDYLLRFDVPELLAWADRLDQTWTT